MPRQLTHPLKVHSRLVFGASVAAARGFEVEVVEEVVQREEVLRVRQRPRAAISAAVNQLALHRRHGSHL